MGNINVEWHNKNKMGKNPSHDFRMKWHIEHTKHCSCRKPSEKILREIAEWQNKKK